MRGRFQMLIQLKVRILTIRNERQARLGLQRWLAFGAGRQHIGMAVQLGGQMAHPALRFPALAAYGQLGLVEDHRDARHVEGRLQRFECVFDRRLQRHQHCHRLGIAQHLHVDRCRLVFQHDLRAGQCQGFAQTLARLPGPAQQGHWSSHSAIILGHGRSPAGHTRFASDPTLGKACPGTAARQSRRRAGDAFHRCAR